MYDYLVKPIGDRMGRILGEGGTSRVTLELDPKTGKEIAVKHLSLSCDKMVFIREIESLANLNHPFVVHLISWAFPQGGIGGEIHMEYAVHGSLEDVLSKVRTGNRPKFWDATGIGIFICGMVLGMRFVHSRKIIHRDLKPSNILVNERGLPLISDFGISRCEKDDGTPTPGADTGTVRYAAPELFEQDSPLTTKSDVFTFGLILYELLTCHPVFSPSIPAFDVIRRHRSNDFPVIPCDCGAVMEELIRGCWSVNLETRPSFNEMFSSLERCNFRILPNVDETGINEFCLGIQAWEESAGY
jgi:serine/threonine protein kinase